MYEVLNIPKGFGKDARMLGGKCYNFSNLIAALDGALKLSMLSARSVSPLQ